MFEIVKDLCELPIKEQIDVIRNLNDQQHMIYDYLKGVWLPGLYKENCMDERPVLVEDEYMKSVEELVVRLNMHGMDVSKWVCYVC